MTLPLLIDIALSGNKQRCGPGKNSRITGNYDEFQLQTLNLILLMYFKYYLLIDLEKLFFTE